MVTSDREESSPYAAMLAAQAVVENLEKIGVQAVHIKLRARGGTGTKTPGPGAQNAIRALARASKFQLSLILVFWFQGLDLFDYLVIIDGRGFNCL